MLLGVTPAGDVYSARQLHEFLSTARFNRPVVVPVPQSAQCLVISEKRTERSRNRLVTQNTAKDNASVQEEIQGGTDSHEEAQKQGRSVARQGVHLKFSELKYAFCLHRHRANSQLVKTCQNSSLAFFGRLQQHSRPVQGRTVRKDSING